MSALGRIAVVLVEPQSGGNVGGAARALANMGLSRLVLVAPAGPLGEEARRMAMGGMAILESARVARTLQEAVGEAQLVIGTTRRAGKNRGPLLDVSEAARKAVEAAAAGNDVALVFGREDSGLTTGELDACGLLARIPAAEACPSLNLAQAVLIAAYEVRRAAETTEAGAPRDIAPAREVEGLFRQFGEVLDEIGFLNPQNPEEVMHSLRRLFGRAELDPREVRILRGILSQVRWAAGRRARGASPAEPPAGPPARP